MKIKKIFALVLATSLVLPSASSLADDDYDDDDRSRRKKSKKAGIKLTPDLKLP